MKRNLFKAISIALTLVMLLSAAGCAGGKENSSSGGGGDGGSGEKNDTITVVTSGEPKALDPMCGATDRTSGVVYNNIYESLLKVDDNGNIVPNLASYTQIDDVTYEFQVVEGVKFHNGEELKASDIAFTMKKGAETPITQYLWGSIDTDSIEVLGDYSLRIKLKEPCSPFLALMTCVPAAIVNEKYITEVGDGSGTKPIGTGPYKFVEWKKGESITLERFEDYHGDRPDVGKVVFRTVPEAANRTIELESGGCDIACDVPISDLSRVEGTPGLTLRKVNGNSIRYIGFNTAKEPLNDVKVRQALASAIDIQGIVTSVLQGTGTVATCPISPNIMFFDSEATMRPYDPDGAKKLLAEAGYPNGFATTIWTDDKKENVDIATIVQTQLAAIGVTAEIKASEWGAFITSSYNGEIDLYIMDWSSASPDPDIIFNSVFNSQMLGQGGNVSRLEDAKVDELLQAGRTSQDNAERTKIYKELQERLYDLAPWVYLWVDDVYVGTSDRIETMKVHPLQTHPISQVKLK